MLTITVPESEVFDERTNEFHTLEAMTLELEHSLVSLHLWESKWEKPFISPGEKTTEETIGYVQAMTLTPNVSPEVYLRLSNDNLREINSYIESKMTATWFKELPGQPKGGTGEMITAELIFYWMVAFNIPSEYKHWHLNQLFTLIRIANEKNKPKKKMSRADMVSERQRLNAERKAALQTTG